MKHWQLTVIRQVTSGHAYGSSTQQFSGIVLPIVSFDEEDTTRPRKALLIVMKEFVFTLQVSRGVSGNVCHILCGEKYSEKLFFSTYNTHICENGRVVCNKA